MSMLDRVNRPADLRGLDADQLKELCGDIRDFLIRKVSATGGHLGPNLGVVELTVALHRVFDSPRDPLVFDTGHQSYVHKILTGRGGDSFDGLRSRGGLSGYPSRAESEHDIVESSHATASLSYADGLAKAYSLRGESDRTVVAVIGDGAMTGGMCWEALNNIAAGDDRPLVIVVNDNGRSYSPTIGGLADRLGVLRLQPAYEKAMDHTKRTLGARRDLVGRAVYSVLHGIKAGLKDAVAPQELFGDLGLKYVGPVDGHNLAATEAALRRAKDFGGPVVVHVVTRKGNGYVHAENDVADQMHATGIIDPDTGRPLSTSSSVNWTSVFSEELCDIGTERDDVVAITAAMAGPTGLTAFGERFPDRMYDVGIAEQHAIASASGLALGGMHPVVAVYSTFLNRGFDQLLMDVALLRQPVTLVLDRASRDPTGPATTACGTSRWPASSPGSAWPRHGTPRPSDRSSGRRSRSATARPSCGSPRGRSAKRSRRWRPRTTGSTACTGPGGPTYSWWRWARWSSRASPPQTHWRRTGSASTSSTHGGSTRSPTPWPRPPGAVVWWSASRTTASTVASDRRSSRLEAAGVRVDRLSLGIPQEFLDHASRGEILSELGLTPEGIADSIRAELVRAPVPPAVGARTEDA